MAQLNYLDSAGWAEIMGHSGPNKAHYFTDDNCGVDFPESICGAILYGDLHPYGNSDQPKCKRCLRKVQAMKAGL